MVRILLIEDNPADAKLVEHYLREAFADDFSMVNATRLAQGLNFISNAKFDIVICDITLPDSNGLETFTTVYRAVTDMPIMILTGNRDETLGIEAVKKGAADFLNKNQLDSSILRRSIIYSQEDINFKKKLLRMQKK